VHRGIAIWRDARGNQPRIFLNTRYRLISLDAKTGQPVNTFGDNGVVDSEPGTGLADQQNALHRNVAAGDL
jgi:glucose dehydrogenase